MPVTQTVEANPWPITFSHAWAMQPQSIESPYHACVQYCRKHFETPFNDGLQLLDLPADDPRSYLPSRKAQLAVSWKTLGIFMECNETADALGDEEVIADRVRRAQQRYPLLYCSVDFVNTVSVFFPIGEVDEAGCPLVSDGISREDLSYMVADIRSLFDSGSMISDLEMAALIEQGIGLPGLTPGEIDFCC
jgi:hypothetical protein